MFPLLDQMKSKLLFMMMVLMVDDGGGNNNDVDGVDNGDECGGEKRLKSSLKCIIPLQGKNWTLDFDRVELWFFNLLFLFH